jgi:(p)ppGpp synthase/HD superfamily hydrolase
MNRQQYFSDVADHLSSSDLAYVQRAYWLVKEAHRRQSRRLTGERFFEHVRRVSYAVGITYGYADAHHFALGLLHDIVEDTFTPQDIIVNLFGHVMYHDILVLSKELPAFDSVSGRMIKRAKLSDDEYYPALAAAGPKPRRVKGCDRIDNVADLAQWEPTRRIYGVVKSCVTNAKEMLFSLKRRPSQLVEDTAALAYHLVTECMVILASPDRRRFLA